MSAALPTSSSRPRALTIAIGAYAAVLIAAFATGHAWLDELAAFMLVALILAPALRKRSAGAWLLLATAAAGIALLASAGHGELALDFLPSVVNAALCALFARTLARGREPLIARLIAVLETPARLAERGVASYARSLTRAWAILLGAQALGLAALVALLVPDGLLAALGIAPPIALAGDGWRWYLHLGSYATVLAFLVVEYAFRRWHLRHITHVPLGTFIARLARRWPALARSLGDDAPEPRA